MNFESVHNYYEHLVYDEIIHNLERYGLKNDNNLLEDVACVALNRLPAKYIRYDIDLAFYLSSDERARLETSVRDAVRYAASYVTDHAQKRSTNSPA